MDFSWPTRPFTKTTHWVWLLEFRMSKHNFSASCTSVCGHADISSFTYGSKTANAQTRLYAANTLCSECTRKIKELLQPVDKGFFKLELPTLAGSYGAVSYANSLRIQRLRSVGPTMAKLAKSDEPYAATALAVFRMLFKITDARFWIQGKDLNTDWSWMAFEIAFLMRKSHSNVIRPMANSAHAYWLTMNHAVIAEAAESLPAIAPSLPQQPSSLVSLEATPAA